MKTYKYLWLMTLVFVLLQATACVQQAAPVEAPAAAEAPVEEAEPVDLEFTIWTFDVEQVQNYLDDWEQTAPMPVNGILNDVDWGQYHDTMTAQFVAETGPDVMYASDHWLQEWASAGWLVPLKEVFPADEVDELSADMFPFTLQGMTYQDEIYGLPYYSDPIAFVYNTRMYEEAGIAEPPKSWEEVLEHARTLKEADVLEYPLGFGWSQDEPFSIEVVTAMLMSRGDEFFDDELNPTFVTAEGEPIMESTLAQHIEWVKTALEEGLMDPETLTRDGVVNSEAVMAGTQAYGMTRASSLAAWQDPNTSAEAGNLEMITIPGSTEQTLGFVRFYAVTNKMLERDQAARDAAWDFFKYFGGPGPEGDYPVVRQWALKWGLGFGPEPLYNDPQIREAFGAWGDVELLEETAKTARARKLSPWYSAWDVFTRAELQRAYLGETSTEEALVNIADRWNTLRAEYEE